MPATVVGTTSASNQPFQCHVCLTRFTRNENLKRHAALHTRSQRDSSLPCGYCPAKFSRPDLRRRHIKKAHPELDERQPSNKLQRNSAALQQEYEAGLSPARQSTLSKSPEESRCALTDVQSLGYGPREVDQMVLNSQSLDSGRQPYDGHSYRDKDDTNFAGSVPTSIDCDRSSVEASSISIHSSSVGSLEIDPHVPSATSLEQSLISGSRCFKPVYRHHSSAQMQPVTTASSTPIFDSHHSSPSTTSTLHTADSLLSEDLRRLQEKWIPSASQITRGIYVYFMRVSHFVPFLHQPTFDVTKTTDSLLLSMLSLAYQYVEDPECGDTPGSGVELARRCFHHARVLLSLNDEKMGANQTRNLAIIQSYLLLQICAMLYLCGEDSAYGLQMHSQMIFLARSGGLLQSFSTNPCASEDLESLWYDFVRGESHKRTLFAVHQIDALWYQLLSIPRSVSHLEIKHDLPCSEDCWTASSAAQWAHRRLLSTHPGPPVQFGDAIRRFLSADPDIESIPAFDSFGAVNIAQFFISSSREITGWSTMTGRLCIERLEPLRSSLEALQSLVRPIESKTSTLFEATCEMAMIELQIWSPAHTGGIVGGSVDELLKDSTYLTPSYEILVDTHTAKSIQPNVNWFLLHLDASPVPDSEPPWVVLYAYKAFLIAWRLVCGGSLGAMHVVGVADGDMEGALKWAKKVFQRRQCRQLGKLIITCLDMLPDLVSSTCRNSIKNTSSYGSM